MSFKNFPMVPRVVYGRGSAEQIEEIAEPIRKNGYPIIYFADHCFENKSLAHHIPVKRNDKIIFIDTSEEPKTSYVDKIRDDLKEEFGKISGIIGYGGGSVMDMTKAVSLMMTNPGSSADYQGWDLVKNEGVYHAGVPTLSGTGAEVSRTCVLTGPVRKLGMNSDFTPFNQVILDPNLTQGAPKDQAFFTGMDCYIHCIESLNGTFLNAFSKSYGEKALELCKKNYLEKAEWDDESNEDLMMASWHGGMSIAYSQVGVAHALSYGLSYILGIKHGVGNCIAFDQIEEYYPEGVHDFKKMVDKFQVEIPKNVCAHLSDNEMNKMVQVALNLVPLWENALGKNWKEKINENTLRELYEKM
ncbi:iron-containing alcohol dehydrogenase family protein [Moheibacter lacus]|uniref:Iron-containing alcohol dehydrogenase n=1 Tax=Moheibacter lacus TaxID=2745851 RepID=A0A838ZQT8_9FLAO|nr:iron-containing alcohol dehydrogenase family protein [Moheibacter lacus]MBA5628442.1 iron-containing alcohol dehydrogenase [Moheibacter lacus]